MFSVPKTIFVRNVFKLSGRLWQAVGYESLETMSLRACFFQFFQVLLNLYVVEGNKWRSAQAGLRSLVLLGGHGCRLCPQAAFGKARMAGGGCVHMRLGGCSATEKSPVLDLLTA